MCFTCFLFYNRPLVLNSQQISATSYVSEILIYNIPSSTCHIEDKNAKYCNATCCITIKFGVSPGVSLMKWLMLPRTSLLYFEWDSKLCKVGTDTFFPPPSMAIQKEAGSEWSWKNTPISLLFTPCTSYQHSHAGESATLTNSCCSAEYCHCHTRYMLSEVFFESESKYRLYSMVYDQK